MRTGFFEVAASAMGAPQVCISIYAPVAPRAGVPVLRSRFLSAWRPTPLLGLGLGGVTLGLTCERSPGAAAPKVYQDPRQASN